MRIGVRDMVGLVYLGPGLRYFCFLLEACKQVANYIEVRSRLEKIVRRHLTSTLRREYPQKVAVLSNLDLEGV